MERFVDNGGSRGDAKVIGQLCVLSAVHETNIPRSLSVRSSTASLTSPKFPTKVA